MPLAWVIRAVKLVKEAIGNVFGSLHAHQPRKHGFDARYAQWARCPDRRCSSPWSCGACAFFQAPGRIASETRNFEARLDWLLAPKEPHNKWEAAKSW